MKCSWYLLFCICSSGYELWILILDHGSIFDPLVFETAIFIGEDLFPLSLVSLDYFDLNARWLIVFLIEFDLNNCFLVKSFNFITLFFVIDCISFYCQSQVLVFLNFSIITIQYIVSLVFIFSKNPFVFEFVAFNIFLDVIEDHTWFDGTRDIIWHNIIESQVCKTFISNKIESFWSSRLHCNSLWVSCWLCSLLRDFRKNIVSYLLHVISSWWHPWVFSNLFNCRTIFSIETKHFDDKVLKVVGQVLTTSLLPISGVISCAKQVVEVLIFLSFFEWEYSLNNNE